MARHRQPAETAAFKDLETQIQAGYQRLAAGDVQTACRTWLAAWRGLQPLLDTAGLRSIGDVDAHVRGRHPLSNWLQDLEAELWNAGLEDPAFLTVRAQVCEEALQRFPTDDALLIENRRRAIAESYTKLGDLGKAETLYQEWLTADPRWGWGWIGWADTYRFFTAVPDLTRAEQLLQEGLAIPDVRDRADLAERLADLYDEQGRHAEAKTLRQQATAAAEAAEAAATTLEFPALETVAGQKITITFDDPGVPLSDLPKVTAALRQPSGPPAAGRHKIGRNDPCPCGSGKKYKKCCGRGPATV